MNAFLFALSVFNFQTLIVNISRNSGVSLKNPHLQFLMKARRWSPAEPASSQQSPPPQDDPEGPFSYPLSSMPWTTLPFLTPRPSSFLPSTCCSTMGTGACGLSWKPPLHPQNGRRTSSSLGFHHLPRPLPGFPNCTVNAELHSSASQHGACTASPGALVNSGDGPHTQRF
jgi:hypothetical protein